MSEWQVFQWGDGSQDGQDKWNIGIAGWETSIAFDLPKEVAQEIVDAHNLGAAENKRLEKLTREQRELEAQLQGEINELKAEKAALETNFNKAILEIKLMRNAASIEDRMGVVIGSTNTWQDFDKLLKMMEGGDD